MVKIKQKKTMNLPQLIEWAWDNDVRGKMFPTDQNQEVGIYIATNRDFMMSNADYIKYSNTFKVEVEEEITLTTPLPAMLHVWKTGILGTEIKEVENKSIASQYTVCSTEFWLKQDDEMTLIWRDGRLIE
ncbi:hypothetical protein [Staphylococcus cohnii]|uniref:hypothetical protein n=1 Tax=Staphylococcus cohnii TaxID=29382 RepID=UPI003D7E68FB